VPSAVVIVVPAAKVVVPEGASQILLLASPVLRTRIDDVRPPTNVLAGRTWSGRLRSPGGMMSRNESSSPEFTAMEPVLVAGRSALQIVVGYRGPRLAAKRVDGGRVTEALHRVDAATATPVVAPGSRTLTCLRGCATLHRPSARERSSTTSGSG
jgi:hypothetical protein